MQVGWVTVRVAARAHAPGVRAATQPPEPVVAEALGVLSCCQGAGRQARTARWRVFCTSPGHPVLVVVAEGLVVGPIWKSRLRSRDIAGCVEGARLVVEDGVGKGVGHAQIRDSEQRIVRNAVLQIRIGTGNQFRVRQLAGGASKAGVGCTCEQRSVPETRAEAAEPTLGGVAHRHNFPVGIGLRQLVPCVVESVLQRVAGSAYRQRRACLLTPRIVAVTG